MKADKVLKRRGFLMQAGGFLLLTSGVFYGCGGGGEAIKPPLSTSTTWLTALRSEPVEGTVGASSSQRALADVKHSTVQGRIWGTADSSGLPTAFTQAIASTDGRTGFARVLLGADGMPSLISDASTGAAVTVVPDGSGIILRFFGTDGLHQGSIRFTSGTGERVRAEVLPRTRALPISLPETAPARPRSRAVTNWLGAASESLGDSSLFGSAQRVMLLKIAEGLIDAGTTAFTLAGVIALLGGTITALSAAAIATPLVAGILLGLLFTSGVKDLKSRQDSGGNLSIDFSEETTPKSNPFLLAYKAPEGFLVPETVDISFERPTPTPTPTPTPNPGGPPSNPTAGQEWTNPKDGSALIWVPGGTFQMGTNDTDPNYYLQLARPVHSVTLSGFWMGKYEVTVGQYRAYCTATGRSMPSAPSWGWVDRDSNPMVKVTWEDVVAYGTWAGLKLPTEAQWEYAASGGDGRKWPWGNTWDSSRCINYDVGARSTAPVGSRTSGVSPFGMQDMAGNVWEWCSDWWAESYPSAAQTDPVGPSSGQYRVLRGGFWGSGDPVYFRCAYRDGVTPDNANIYNGFRLSSP